MLEYFFQTNLGGGGAFGSLGARCQWEALMKSLFASLAAASVVALAAPAAAQDYLVSGDPLAPDRGSFEYAAPLPPRPLPSPRLERTETVVTTTRRVVREPGFEAGYDPGPESVVTTRRILTPAPIHGGP